MSNKINTYTDNLFKNANKTMVLSYFEITRMIIEKEQESKNV
jgi:hypothetical protein